MKYTNKHNIAPIFCRAIEGDPYTMGAYAKYSASNLIAPPKQVWLARTHRKEIVSDYSDFFAVLRGNAMHLLLERHAESNGLAEERLDMLVADIPISTKPDHYDGNTKELSDYKTTSKWSFVFGDKPEWTWQLNIGAHFLRSYGFEVKRLVIHAMIWDWNRNEAKRDSSYPQTPFHSVDIPLWSNDDTEHFIRTRLTALELTEIALNEGQGLPDCSPEERWERPTKYAVIKKGNKKATRVLDTKEDAENYVDKSSTPAIMEIVKRPGEAVRCLDYCDAAPWCEQKEKP